MNDLVEKLGVFGITKCGTSELRSNDAAVLIENMHTERAGKLVDDLGLGLVKRLSKIVQINAPCTARSKIACRQRFTRSNIPDKECCKHGRSSMRSPTTGLYRIRLLGALHTKKGFWITKSLLMLSERLGAVHRSAAPCPPTVYTAVLSALGGLASGFGTGPGVPPLPWPLTGGRRPPARGTSAPACPQGRTARSATSRNPWGAPERRRPPTIPAGPSSG